MLSQSPARRGKFGPHLSQRLDCDGETRLESGQVRTERIRRRVPDDEDAVAPLDPGVQHKIAGQAEIFDRNSVRVSQPTFGIIGDGPAKKIADAPAVIRATLDAARTDRSSDSYRTKVPYWNEPAPMTFSRKSRGDVDAPRFLGPAR